jgi:hypothetical protein
VGKIQFITNSSFYRNEEVSGKAYDLGGLVHPQTRTSLRQLEARIQAAHGEVRVN